MLKVTKAFNGTIKTIFQCWITAVMCVNKCDLIKIKRQHPKHLVFPCKLIPTLTQVMRSKKAAFDY